ncbi:MAG: exopolysaccharide biosynthesis protein [Alphaproteobacteria bacterium]
MDTTSAQVWTAEAFDGRPERTSDLLIHLAETAQTERVTIGALADALSDRAFGVLMLALALPCAIPFLYGVPQVVSVPLIFLSAQIVLGRHTVWLPQTLRRRHFSRASFLDMARRAKRYVGWAEYLSFPRLSWLTRGLSERVLGALMLVFCASIAVPLPLTNTVPGIAVGIMSVGFIERDGLLVIAGTVLGTIWVSALLLAAAGVTAGIVSLLGMS